ncbi:MAG: helix-turn-helix transcriptional regulator [Solirubrobacteraceae bacterium]
MSDRPGDVLSQSTRARLFARLASLGRPAGTEELAAELGLHPSGVRVHLERLLDAGLIARERAPQPLGRPRDSWSIAPNSRAGGEPPDAYPRLARWLARSIPSTPGRLRAVERAGRQMGRELVAERGQFRAEVAMGRMLTALGFAPQRSRTKNTTVFTLGNCPYREAVRENQPVVCALHRGLTLGLLDQLDPRAGLKEFVSKDPDRAGCLIEVQGLEPA